MPPVLKGLTKEQLPSYPEKLSRQLKLKLFPLGTCCSARGSGSVY
jgi:hypothetical protein